MHNNHNIQGSALLTIVLTIYAYIGDVLTLFSGVDTTVIQPIMHISQLIAAVVAIVVGIKALRKKEE